MNVAWTNIKLMIEHACNLFVPRVKVRSKPQPQWFNASIRHLLNRTHTLRRKYRSHPTNANHNKLHIAETQLESTICTAKDNYLQNLVSTFHSKQSKLYHHLKSLSQNKFRPQFINKDNVFVTNPMEIAK